MRAPSTYSTTADIYVAALARGDAAPTRAVASALGVSRATAGRYVAAARDRGWISNSWKVGNRLSLPCDLRTLKGWCTAQEPNVRIDARRTSDSAIELVALEVTS